MRLWHVSLLVFCFALLATSCSCIKIPYTVDTLVTALFTSWITALASMALLQLTERAKNRKDGVRVNPLVVDDYVDGCTNNIILTFIAFILGLLYVITKAEQIITVVVSILASQVATVLIVATGLAIITRLSMETQERHR